MVIILMLLWLKRKIITGYHLLILSDKTLSVTPSDLARNPGDSLPVCVYVLVRELIEITHRKGNKVLEIIIVIIRHQNDSFIISNKIILFFQC